MTKESLLAEYVELKKLKNSLPSGSPTKRMVKESIKATLDSLRKLEKQCPSELTPKFGWKFRIKNNGNQ